MITAGINEELLRDHLVRLIPRLRRFAKSLTKDSDKADDLVQAACERALDRLDHVREGTRFDSWLYRIVYTRWIDRIRRRKTRLAHLTLLEKESDLPATNGKESSRLAVAMDVRKALTALPEDHRAAILLVCVEGYSYAEAATVLDVPAGTVASRVARARTTLGRLLYRNQTETLSSLPVDIKEGEK